MIEVNINNIKMTYGFKNVLDDFSLEIHRGERISIIGDNGCGKSTLLNIIVGQENPLSGNISIKKGSKMGYLRQQVPNIYNEMVVKDILYSSVKEIFEIGKKLQKYEEQMLQDPNDYNIINKYLSMQEKYQNIGGYAIDSLIDKVSYGLKISAFLEKKFSELSGGEQKRVLLSALIIQKPNILLLDEPTNHLDISMLTWLESFLKKYDGTIIVVSHDQFFLDTVTTKTILMENGKAIVFYGNYSFYLKENELRIEREFKEYKENQKLILAMKKKIKQLEEFGRLAFPCGESFFKRAENIRKRLDRIEKVDKPIIKDELPIKLQFDNRSGNDVLHIKNFDLKIANKVLIKNIDLALNYGDHGCIIGNNGCGKTTLIKEIMRNHNDSIKIGSNVKMGYIPQHILFPENVTILEYVRNFYIGADTHLRSTLNKFYFHGDSVFKRVNNLSGGEKVRLKLLELVYNNSNFIILDEPTNHIDLFTKEALEESLKEYSGTLLFISHDRFFINEIANKIFYIDNQKITEYPGNYDDLKKYISHME